ncbi:Metallo-dependent phosphatase-like protein, partial [Dissophora ornata]
KRRRTIVVGDIHGNLEGFNGFLKKIKYDSSADVLILAGDLVAKGPKSLKVIDKARDLKAKCVRGNHDDKVIRWRGFLDSLSLQELNALDAEDTNLDDDMEQQPHIPSDLDKNSEHYQIARAMSKSQYNYLRNCPLILTLPRNLSIHNIPIHVVHAGIDPRRDILKQKPWVLINVRNLLKDGTPSRKKSDGEGWANAFNEMHGRRSPTKQDFLVVYGHDAGRSLNVKTWSIGIDSGCVYGRELTGYVVETGKILSVSC